MKTKLSVFAVILSLLLIGMLVALMMEVEMIIKIIVFSVIGLVVIVYMIKGGEKRNPMTEKERFKDDHHREVRSTSLGCYGPEAEEEKFGYEKRPPKQSR